MNNKFKQFLLNTAALTIIILLFKALTQGMGAARVVEASVIFIIAVYFINKLPLKKDGKNIKGQD